jgi:hypothetical protein
MKKSQLLFWLLLLPLLIHAQRRSEKESPHSLAVSFGVPVIHKSYVTDYVLPLNFIYEYTKKKNSFGMGIQLSYGHKSFVNNIRDSNEIVEKYCRAQIFSSFASDGIGYYYDGKDDYFNINIPLYYRRYFSDASSDFQFFAQAGLIANINIWSQNITHFPLIVRNLSPSKCSIIDLKPHERFDTSTSFRPISTDLTIGGGFKYNLSKNQSLFGILQYEYSFEAYSNGQKLNLYLGYSFRI